MQVVRSLIWTNVLLQRRLGQLRPTRRLGLTREDDTKSQDLARLTCPSLYPSWTNNARNLWLRRCNSMQIRRRLALNFYCLLTWTSPTTPSLIAPQRTWPRAACTQSGPPSESLASYSMVFHLCRTRGTPLPVSISRLTTKASSSGPIRRVRWSAFEPRRGDTPWSAAY